MRSPGGARVKPNRNNGNFAAPSAGKTVAPQRVNPGKPREASPRQAVIDRAADPPVDVVDLASMDSFPCSDPPGYYPVHC
jgi:hypothetical protein